MAENERRNVGLQENTAFDSKSTTDFGPRQQSVEDPRNFVTPKEGIGKDPILLEGLGDLFKGAVEARKAGKTSGVLTEFTKKQLAIVEGLEQGDIKSSRQARTVLRKNLIDFIDAYPGAYDDLIKAHKDVLGFSDVVDEGTRQEQRYQSRVDDLHERGLLSGNESGQEIEAAIAEDNVRQARLRVLEDRSKELNVKLSQENLTTKQEARLKREFENNVREWVNYASPDYLKITRNNIDKILKSDLSEADKEAQIEDLFIQFRSDPDVRQMRAVLGSEESEAFFTPFEMLKELSLKQARGELGDAEVERKLERIENINASILAQEPIIQKTLGLKKIFGEEAFLDIYVNTPELNNTITKFVGSNFNESEEKANLFVEGGNAEAVKGYIEGVSNVLRNPTTDDGKSEAQEQLLNSLEGFVNHEGILRNKAIKGRAIVESFATQRFYEAISKNPELKDDPRMESARQVLRDHYQSEVMGMVKRQFTENNVIPEHLLKVDDPTNTTGLSQSLMGGGIDPEQQQATPDAVSYRTTSNGMEFYAIDGSNALAVNKARDLNKTLAPIIRNVVKADAHLMGTNDYGAVWEGMAQDVLGGGAGSNQTPSVDDDFAGGDAGDNLNLEDFLSGNSVLDEAMSTGGFVGDGDYTSAETPEDVAASFIGFTEKEHKNVLSSFIKETVGMNINPSTTAWCAAFVNAALGAKGVEGTKTLTAKDFLNWGEEVDTPKKGDIVVFDRGAPGDWRGHVGFYVGPSKKKGYVRVLGGNQDDKVSIKDYSLDRLEGFRRGSI